MVQQEGDPQRIIIVWQKVNYLWRWSEIRDFIEYVEERTQVVVS